MRELDDEWMAALMAAMRAASSAEILPRFQALSAGSVRTKTAADDLVTDADIGAELALAAQLSSLFGTIAVVGEEAVSGDASILDRLESAELVAVIDPVDGTWNFVHGVPVFGSALAIVSQGRTIAGLIHYPVLDDFIIARPGRGAWLVAADGTSTRLSAASTSSIEHMHGFVPLHMYPIDVQEALAPRLTRFARTTTWRCSTFEYRMLATGAMSFCANAGLSPWDHAAGVLIHAEAGGYAALLDGRPYQPTCREGILLAAPDRASWSKIKQALFED
jgi:fructose-1,6-bisphosphatase/inositol monophosphatase family enzyme